MIDGMINKKKAKKNQTMIHRWIVQQNRQRHGANRRLFAYASCFADFLKPILRGTSNASFRECGGSKLL